MPIAPQIRKNWLATQKKFDYPVNAIGVKIDPHDAKTMKVWHDENIDEDGRIKALLAASKKAAESKPAPAKKSSGETLTYRGVPIQ